MNAKAPLSGVRVVVTRPDGQSRELTEWLREAGAEVIHRPSIQLRELLWRLPDLPRFGWLMFTSQNGVRFFMRRVMASGIDEGVVARMKVAAVGAATARALSEFGVAAACVADEFTTERFAEVVASRIEEGDQVLYPCANERNRGVARRLRSQGAEVTELVIYESRRRTVAPVEADLITFASARTARSFLGQVKTTARIVSIGPVTTREVERLGFQVAATATRHDARGLFEAVLEAAGRGRG